jgi:hypothetical protein
MLVSQLLRMALFVALAPAIAPRAGRGRASAPASEQVPTCSGQALDAEIRHKIDAAKRYFTATRDRRSLLGGREREWLAGT